MFLTPKARCLTQGFMLIILLAIFGSQRPSAQLDLGYRK